MDIDREVNIFNCDINILEMILRLLETHEVLIFTRMISKRLKRKCKGLNWKNMLLAHQLFHFCGGGNDLESKSIHIFRNMFNDKGEIIVTKKEREALLKDYRGGTTAHNFLYTTYQKKTEKYIAETDDWIKRELTESELTTCYNSGYRHYYIYLA